MGNLLQQGQNSRCGTRDLNVYFVQYILDALDRGFLSLNQVIDKAKFLY